MGFLVDESATVETRIAITKWDRQLQRGASESGAMKVGWGKGRWFLFPVMKDKWLEGRQCNYISSGRGAAPFKPEGTSSLVFFFLFILPRECQVCAHWNDSTVCDAERENCKWLVYFYVFFFSFSFYNHMGMPRMCRGNFKKIFFYSSFYIYLTRFKCL